MSPELQRLLEARWERDHGENRERHRWAASHRRQLEDLRARLPAGASWEQFLDALEVRYRDYCRSRRPRPPTLPPAA